MSGVGYVPMRATACDGAPAGSKPLPFWAQLAAERQGKKVGDEMEARFGLPVVMVVRTHWHRDGSICAHIADRAYKITKRKISLRRPE